MWALDCSLPVKDLFLAEPFVTSRNWVALMGTVSPCQQGI